jgi:hypothetical protein
MNRILALLLLTACFSATGCRNRLVFGTQTSVGLDISGTGQVPTKVALSYNRQEVAYVPRKVDDSSHSVYGGLDADATFTLPPEYIIKQTFATGAAATNAAHNARNDPGKNGDQDPPAGDNVNRKKSNPQPSKTSSEGQKKNEEFLHYPLSFYTATKFGLHLSIGEAQMAPNALIGYRRMEATVIPIPNPTLEVRPVFADIEINSTDRSLNGRADSPQKSSLGGVRIRQSFATGQAAVIASSKEDVKRKLDEAAGTRVNAYRTEHKTQVIDSLEVIAEYSSATQSKRDKILEKAKQAKVVDGDTTHSNFVSRIRASPDAASVERGGGFKELSEFSKSL